MKQSPINKVSKKQAAKNRAWVKITHDKIAAGIVCENCGGSKTDWRGISGGHHKDPRRNGDYSAGNHVLLCCACHAQIHHIKEA